MIDRKNGPESHTNMCPHDFHQKIFNKIKKIAHCNTCH